MESHGMYRRCGAGGIAWGDDLVLKEESMDYKEHFHSLIDEGILKKRLHI
ncbi:MAG: hypothetical protein ACLVJ6_00505 [Merdibacter sp.]